MVAPVTKSEGKSLQQSLYDQDMDADVDAIGPHHTTLQVRWVLATKMSAYKVNQNQTFQRYFNDMRQLGFKKFILTNGYDNSWVWTLDNSVVFHRFNDRSWGTARGYWFQDSISPRQSAKLELTKPVVSLLAPGRSAATLKILPLLRAFAAPI
jgi:hypothetical protein